MNAEVHQSVVMVTDQLNKCQTAIFKGLKNNFKTPQLHSIKYLVHQFLPQSFDSFRVEAQEHQQRGGCAGRGFMAPEQQLCSRLFNGLETQM